MIKDLTQGEEIFDFIHRLPATVTKVYEDKFDGNTADILLENGETFSYASQHWEDRDNLFIRGQLPFRLEDRVYSPVYGEGVIANIIKTDETTTYEVNFTPNQYGHKSATTSVMFDNRNFVGKNINEIPEEQQLFNLTLAYEFYETDQVYLCPETVMGGLDSYKSLKLWRDSKIGLRLELMDIVPIYISENVNVEDLTKKGEGTIRGVKIDFEKFLLNLHKDFVGELSAIAIYGNPEIHEYTVYALGAFYLRFSGIDDFKKKYTIKLSSSKYFGWEICASNLKNISLLQFGVKP
jgi:hypothetical protein